MCPIECILLLTLLVAAGSARDMLDVPIGGPGIDTPVRALCAILNATAVELAFHGRNCAASCSVDALTGVSGFAFECWVQFPGEIYKCFVSQLIRHHIVNCMQRISARASASSGSHWSTSTSAPFSATTTFVTAP